MRRSGEPFETHVQLGVVNATLSTRLRGLTREYRGLYSHALIGEAGERSIRIEVNRSPWSLLHRRRFRVFVNGRLQFEPARRDELLPCVEWSINWEVPRVWPEYLQLHASSMEVNGKGVILPGQSGSGKSTLAAGLLSRGWRYLCDEFAMLHAESLHAHPYPRAICIKQPSYPVIESLGLGLHGHRHYLKGSKGYVGFIQPQEARVDAIGSACPVRYVIFPKYTAGATPALIPIHRAEAAFALHKVCFNLLGCQSTGLDVMVKMVQGASCFRLISGDIHQTCDLLQELVEGNASAIARSA